MVKVSVIIPVYNAEKYLKECLDSITKQTLTDIEIICINDGSTDNSLNILQEYKKYDDRFTIISQENQGQAVARNKGMKLIKGDYFCFMDADDILDLHTFEECYTLIKNKSLDFVMYKLINFDETSDEYYTSPGYNMTLVHNFVKNDVFNYESLNELIFYITVSPVNKLYRTEFVFNTNARFPEGTIFEDNLFFWRLLFNAKRIYFHDKYFYKRRRHSESTTGEGSAKWLDAIEIYNKVWDIFKEFGQFEKFKNRLYNNKVNFALYRLNNIKEEHKELFFQAWKNDLKNINKNYLDFVENLNSLNRYIFNAVILSKDYTEFYSMLHIYEDSNKIKNLEKKIHTIKNSTNKLLELNSENLNRIKDLELKNQELTEKNKSLNKKLKNQIQKSYKFNDELRFYKLRMLEYYQLKETNEKITTSTSWKITKPFRKLMNLIKK